ncbi:MAG: carbohydrate-binding domain-containing protein [Acutalibacteraceae bacterium]
MAKKSLRIFTSLFVTLALTIPLGACGSRTEETKPLVTQEITTMPEEQTENSQASDTSANTQETIDTYVILNNENTTIKGGGASFSSGVLTISESGTYSIKGTLSDGNIFINSPDEAKKVKLYLDGVNIHCTKTAPIYVENSPKETEIILAENSQNNLSDNADRELKDESGYATAVIYSKDDLQIEGSGILNISANFNKGIFCKNDLQIKGGTLNITSTDDAIRAKDSIEISCGTINANSGGDAIRTNADESEKGDIIISGGTINLTSELDAVQSTKDLQISGGNITATVGGGSSETAVNQENKGFGFFPASAESSVSEASSSQKAFKAAGDIVVSGGSFKSDSVDDAFHCGGDMEISGGTFSVKTNDDAFHSDNNLEISAGNIIVNRCNEGIEGTEIKISGGNISVRSSDDAINAASQSESETQNEAQTAQDKKAMGPGNKPGGRGGPGGADEYDSSCIIEISGGKINLNADGDGIDSNGDIKMTGGNLTVFGSQDGGNSAVDYAGKFELSGGTLLAVGDSRMAQGITESSVSYLQFDCNINANTTVTIADKNNEQIVSFVSSKNFTNVLYASDKIQSGETYSFLKNTTHTGTASGGVYSDGSFSGGTSIGSFKAVG